MICKAVSEFSSI